MHTSQDASSLVICIKFMKLDMNIKPAFNMVHKLSAIDAITPPSRMVVVGYSKLSANFHCNHSKGLIETYC